MFGEAAVDLLEAFGDASGVEGVSVVHQAMEKLDAFRCAGEPLDDFAQVGVVGRSVFGPSLLFWWNVPYGRDYVLIVPVWNDHCACAAFGRRWAMPECRLS